MIGELEHDKAHLFHTKEMYDIFMHTKGISPVFISIYNENKLVGIAFGEVTRVLGLLSRTTFYAEPIYTGNFQILDQLLKEIISKSSGILIDIRPHYKLTDDELKIYFQNGFIFNNHLNAILPLSNKEDIWNNLADDKKKGILFARKQGVEIRELNTLQGVDLFYDLVSSLYKKKKRIFKSKAYFQNLLNSDKFHFLFAFYNETPIAAQLYYIYKETITAYYTATNPDFNDKHAGDLLIWELIKIGVEKNLKTLDFGGGGKPNKPYGVREYKKRFGTTFENIGRLIYSPAIVRPIVNRVYTRY